MGRQDHTHLEDLHLLQHELLHFLVILGQHNDLLHCPAVWNGPGRTSVGLGTLGKGQSFSPFPTRAPNPLGQWSRHSLLRLKGFPGSRIKGVMARVCLPSPILGSIENRTLGHSPVLGVAGIVRAFLWACAYASM